MGVHEGNQISGSSGQHFSRPKSTLQSRGLVRFDLRGPGEPVTILLDAGPVLNFLAVSNQDVLIKVAERRRVRGFTCLHELRARYSGRPTTTTAPAGLESTWRNLRSSSRVMVLPDDITSQAFEDAKPVARNS